jgi:hypothetical protein
MNVQSAGVRRQGVQEEKYFGGDEKKFGFAKRYGERARRARDCRREQADPEVSCA